MKPMKHKNDNRWPSPAKGEIGPVTPRSPNYAVLKLSICRWVWRPIDSWLHTSLMHVFIGHKRANSDKFRSKPYPRYSTNEIITIYIYIRIHIHIRTHISNIICHIHIYLYMIYRYSYMYISILCPLDPPFLNFRMPRQWVVVPHRPLSGSLFREVGRKALKKKQSIHMCMCLCVYFI